MRVFTLILVVLLNNSCISQKNNSAVNVNDTVQICPEGGTCNFEILKNKRFELVKDGIGKYYPKLTDAKSNILKFEFKSGEIVDVPDSGVTEVVYIEIDKEQNLSIKNQNLKQVKASYGRLCFCRGNSGYFPIKKGELIIKNISRTLYEIEFKFEANEVPQTLKKFKLTTKI